MKKWIYGVLTLISCLYSCNHSEEEFQKTPETLYPVQFTLQWDTEVLPFSKTVTRSMPDLPAYQDPQTKTNSDDTDPSPEPGSDSDITNQPEISYTQIEYIVYQKGEGETHNFLKHQTYTEENSNGDFGIIYDKLPAGEFEIVFITHSDPAATRTGETLNFERVTDTFWQVATYEVSSTTSTNETPTLSRIIGKIEFVSTDIVPTEQTEFRIEVHPYLLTLDLFSGKATGSGETYTLKKTSSSETIGKSGIHTLYTFIPDDGRPLTLRLQSVGANEAILRERQIESVNPLANRTLRYTGILYTPPKEGDSFDLQFEEDGAWGATSEKVLPD